MLTIKKNIERTMLIKCYLKYKKKKTFIFQTTTVDKIYVRDIEEEAKGFIVLILRLQVVIFKRFRRFLIKNLCVKIFL